MEIDKEIGSGRYGTVFKTTDKVSGKLYALKHIKMEGETQGFPVTAIREIKILKALDHENIIRLEEVITYGNERPDDKETGDLVRAKNSDMDLSQFLKGSVFMVFEYVEFDLSALILSMKNMTSDHVKCYMKQLLSGIFYMHRQKILHRDLKTANILITRGNVLKIADWGLARSTFTNMQRLSPKVVTLWYRAPELLLETKRYGPEIDIWSVGCIFGELACSQAILPGSIEHEQLEKIFQLCGTPPEGSDVESRLKECDGWEKMKIETFYPSGKLKQRFSSSPIGHCGVELLEKLLCLHPEKRLSAYDALDHNYFWNDPGTPPPSALPPLHLEDAHEAEVTKKRQKKAEERLAKEKAKTGTSGRGGQSKYRLKGPANSSTGNLNRLGRPQHHPSSGGGGGLKSSGGMKRSHSERMMHSGSQASSSSSQHQSQRLGSTAAVSSTSTPHTPKKQSVGAPPVRPPLPNSFMSDSRKIPPPKK